MPSKPASTAFAIALLALTVTAPVAPAGAEDAAGPALRASIVVEGAIVTLGDLFDNAGAAAATPVFRAPDPGETGHVSAARIAEAAARHGLEWRNDQAVTRVAVRRDSTRIGLEEISQKIAEAVRARLSLSPEERVSLTLARASRALHLPASLSGELRVAHLDMAARGGEFVAELTPAGDVASTIRAVYRGSAAITVPVAVLKDGIARGETISPSMVEIRQMPRNRVPADSILQTEDIAGMSARHSLQPGRPLRADDIELPRLVRRNGAVTIIYSRGALTISMHGRSLDDGAKNDVIRVLNLRSNRTVEAIVTGPDQAAVGAGGPARTALLRGNAPAAR